MRVKSYLRAVLIGSALPLMGIHGAYAEILKVQGGSASSALAVPMNRAVVVESETPYTDISIANPGIADISAMSERTIYVLGKAPGRTTLTLLGADGALITNVEVQVTPDVAEFKERLRQILPGEPIEVRTANDGIVLSGTLSSSGSVDRALDLAERYAPGRVSNLMNVGGTQQVMLKVRFAEMQRSVSKDLSASLRAGWNSNRTTAGTSTGGAGSSSGAGGTGTGVSPSSTAFGAFGLGVTRGNFQLGVLLEALESKGMVRTLAEPNLTALSGQEASFLAGGEYPIPVVSDNTVSVEYKPFGVELKFVPRVVDGDLINLQIGAAVSGIDTTTTVQSNGFSVNAFKRRETTTTVEMRDGESFAIAGLLQDDFTDLNSQVPWLGDIPILGALFRSASYQRNQSELVIIVTPHLVTPTRGQALALPTDRVKIPTEADIFLRGKTSRSVPKSGAAAEVAKQDFSGSYGYVME